MYAVVCKPSAVAEDKEKKTVVEKFICAPCTQLHYFHIQRAGEFVLGVGGKFEPFY